MEERRQESQAAPCDSFMTAVEASHQKFKVLVNGVSLAALTTLNEKYSSLAGTEEPHTRTPHREMNARIEEKQTRACIRFSIRIRIPYSVAHFG